MWPFPRKVSAAHFAEIARTVEDRQLVVAVGEFSRVGIFALDHPVPRLLHDLCVTDTEDNLSSQIVDLLALRPYRDPPALLAHWDVMALTKWAFVWIVPESGPFRCWDRRGLVASLEADHLQIGTDSVAVDAVRRIEAFREPSGFRLGVRVTLGDGATLTVAERRELVAYVDPTYAGSFEADADATWAETLARDMRCAIPCSSSDHGKR